MKLRLFVFIIISILFSRFGTKVVAQQNNESIVSEINNQIDSIINICESGDSTCFETWSHGHTKFFKKFLGFIYIRYGKGETFTSSWIKDNEIFYHNIATVRFKQKINHHISESYYYNSNGLNKYKKVMFWSPRNGENDILDGEMILYINNGIVIESQIDIINKSHFKVVEIDYILEQAQNIKNKYDKYCNQKKILE